MATNKRVETRIHLYNGHTYTTKVPFDVFSTFLREAERNNSRWVHIQHEGFDFKVLISEIFLFEGGVLDEPEDDEDEDYEDEVA